MSTAAQQTDPRREHLRQQAIQRRQAVLDRIAGTRTLLIGGAAMASCVLAIYMDANAHARTTGTTGSGSSGSTGTGYGSNAYGSNGYGSSNYGSNNYGGGSSNYGGGQSAFGGGSPPSASSGGGSVTSGGS